jgi:putative transposase
VHRKAALNNRELVVSLIESLEAEANDAGILVYAYCFMPEHVHLLLSPEGMSPEGMPPEGVPSERGKDVVQFVQAYKSKTTRLFWRMGNRGKLWQHGFYDHIVRQEENIKQVARYILDNPVRRGLVDGFLEYPFSGSLTFKKEDL